MFKQLTGSHISLVRLMKSALCVSFSDVVYSRLVIVMKPNIVLPRGKWEKGN